MSRIQSRLIVLGIVLAQLCRQVTVALSRIQSRFIVLGLVLGLFCWIFADAIFRDRNFCYRDAGHFYYPLLKLVQDEWNAGRWPLWNPYENGGMPLLGNATSAVLYPPRVVIFQWLPISYATAYKWYTLLHVLFSAATAYLMVRNWKATELAAGLAAISYAFGAVVMFQYCNIIFLVGAAWVPLGLLATDRMLRDGSWRWAVGLGLVLSLQMLGGDPEAAYVTGGLAAFYLVLLDVQFGICFAGALGLRLLIKLMWRFIGNEFSATKEDYVLAVTAFALVVATPASLWWLRLKRLRPVPDDQRRLQRRRIACLAIAALVAVGVSAVQWIPTWEFTRISLRAAGGIHHEPYAFWVGPWRICEMLWPNVSGHQFPINTRWPDIFPTRDRTWVPSLYFGALALVLAVSAWRVRGVSAWHRWISIILVLSLWAATGPAGGVSWHVNMAHQMRVSIAHGFPAHANRAEDSPQAPEGPPKELETPAGGLYWLLVQVLPGFGSFRFPAKLMTFAAAAFAALAAVGWDRLFSTDGRLYRRIAGFALASLVLAFVALLARPHLTDWFAGSWLAKGAAYYGPLQADAAAWCIVRASVTTSIGLLLVFGVCRLSPSWLNREMGAAVVLLIVAVDVGLANQWMVSTADQKSLDAVPTVTKIIEAEEAAKKSPGSWQPYRIHRVSIWSPPRWFSRVSADQDEEVFRWEKNTIQPKYGLLKFGDLGRFSYTINEGALEPYDYWWFFAPFYSNMTEIPQSIVYHPTRGYDMWGAKYFILPKGTLDKDEHRSLRTFLRQSELIAESEMEEDDYQVRRNLQYLPRAWIVHRLIYLTPITGMVKSDRLDRMRRIIYPGFAETGGLWLERKLEGYVQDPREVAWVEHPDAEVVAAWQAPAADAANDRCQIVRYEPDCVEVEVETRARGLMVLADLYFPGWTATVDGEPTSLVRTNRIMRGVPLRAGKHRVVFEYKPLSVRAGAAITLVSLAGIASALAFSWWRARRQPPQDRSSGEAVMTGGDAAV